MKPAEERGEAVPPWLTAGWGSLRRAPSDSGNLRVSDEERRQVSEVLGRHFAEGRLDQGEFDQRMQAAVTAKTRRELASVLADLPDPQLGRRPRPKPRLLLTLVLALVVVWSTGWLFWPPHVPLILVVLVAWWVWRRHRHRTPALR